MKEKKLTLYSMAKFITREVILQEQVHYSDAFRARLFENYKKSQRFLRNKILTTKISSAIIFGVLPIIPLITYLKMVQYLNNTSISIEIMMFGGSFLFSIFFLVQFFNFFLLAMINTTMIMSGKSLEWYESLPISRETLKKLVLFAIFRSLDLPIIVILTAFPIVMFIGTLDIVLLLICSGISILNFIFSFLILILFAERINRIMDINAISSKKAVLIRLLNMFSYIFIVIGSIFFIQWITTSFDIFFNLFLNYENPASINLLLTLIPFPLNSGYIICLFINPNQIPFRLWLNSFLGLAIFIILIWLLYNKSLKWVNPTIFSKYKPIKKSFLSDNNRILVKVKATSPIIAYLRKDLITVSRDLKAFTSLIIPIFFSFVFTFSYSFINIGGISLLDRDIIFNWLFFVGFNIIISGMIVNGILSIEEANEPIMASLPIISRDQAKAKLIVIFLIQTLSVISPILLFITNPAFIDILMTFLGILPFTWLFLFIMFEMRIQFFSRMRNHYVTEETFPENKNIKWIIIFITVSLLFICIFYALVNIYFTEGFMNVITFSIIVFIIGFVSTIFIFDNLFPDIRKVKKFKIESIEKKKRFERLESNYTWFTRHGWVSIFLLVILYFIFLILTNYIPFFYYLTFYPPRVNSNSFYIPVLMFPIILNLIFASLWIVIVSKVLGLPKGKQSINNYLNSIGLGLSKKLFLVILTNILILFFIYIVFTVFLYQNLNFMIFNLSMLSIIIIFTHIFWQEVAFRGVISTILLNKYTISTATIINSFIYLIISIVPFFIIPFGVYIPFFELFIYAIYSFGFGLLFAYLYAKSKSLIPGIIANILLLCIALI
jgi:membrane protease YdiL (CAAX protease family)